MAPSLLVLGAIAGIAAPAAAQRIAPLTQAIGSASSGLGHATSATSASLSPARLGWNSLPGTTYILPSGAGMLGLRPVTGRNLARYSGQAVPRHVREGWLREIEAEGSQEGLLAVRATPLGVVRGPFSFFLSSAVEGASALNPDAAEAVLFGNAGRTGSPTSLDFDGSRAEGWALTTLGVSGGRFLEGLSGLVPGDVAVGATAKVTLGHAYWSAQDAGSGGSIDPITLQGLLPAVATSSGAVARGLGAGLDVALAWRQGPWIVDVVVHDAVHTFDWSRDSLELRRSELLIGPDSTFEGTESLPFGVAPVALRRRVEAFGFDRSLTVVAGRDFAGLWRGVAELACGPDPLETGASEIPDRACRLGVSTEGGYRELAFLGGLAAGSQGATVGVGLGWVRKAFRLDASYGRRFGGAPVSGLALGATLTPSP